jgi:hypothetical protein
VGRRREPRGLPSALHGPRPVGRPLPEHRRPASPAAALDAGQHRAAPRDARGLRPDLGRVARDHRALRGPHGGRRHDDHAERDRDQRGGGGPLAPDPPPRALRPRAVQPDGVGGTPARRRRDSRRTRHRPAAAQPRHPPDAVRRDLLPRPLRPVDVALPGGDGQPLVLGPGLAPLPRGLLVPHRCRFPRQSASAGAGSARLRGHAVGHLAPAGHDARRKHPWDLHRHLRGAGHPDPGELLGAVDGRSRGHGGCAHAGVPPWRDPLHGLLVRAVGGPVLQHQDPDRHGLGQRVPGLRRHLAERRPQREVHAQRRRHLQGRRLRPTFPRRRSPRSSPTSSSSTCAPRC